MSDAARKWARGVRGVTWAQKSVLMAMALDADAEGVACPSIASLMSDTLLSERAVQGAVAALAKAGLVLVETGGGRGRTSRYVLAIDTTETPQMTTCETPQQTAETPHIATETPQMSAGTPQAVRVPALRSPPLPSPPCSPPFPLHSLPPPIIPPNPSPPPPPSRAKPVVAVTLPAWLPPDAWDAWCQHRLARDRKGWTHAAAVRCVSALERFRDQGDDPRAVIDQSIASGWTGLFALKTRSTPAAANRPDRDWFAREVGDRLLRRDDDAPPRFDFDGHAEETRQ